MILTQRQATKSFQIAIRRLRRKFPEISVGVGEMAEDKIIIENARERWLKALSSDSVEHGAKQYSPYSLLVQSTRYAYRCLIMEARFLIEAIQR